MRVMHNAVMMGSVEGVKRALIARCTPDLENPTAEAISAKPWSSSQLKPPSWNPMTPRR
jgi:hypothetical protein